MRRSKSVSLLTFCLMLLLNGCGPAPDQPEQPLPMKIGIGPYLSYAPMFIAQEEGMFAEQGLEVEFVQLTRSADMIPAIAQGDIDAAGIIITTSLLNLIADGANVRLVADRGYAQVGGCAYSAVLSRPGLPEQVGQGSQPLHLATDRATYQEFLADAALQQAGLSVDAVQVESVTIPTVPELLESGQIDLATAVEPWITRIEDGGQGQVWAAAQDVLPDFQILFYIFGPSILEDNRELGVRFMRAYNKAKLQYDLGPTARNLEILEKYTGEEPDLITNSCWVPLREDLQVDPRSVAAYQEWSVDRGYSDRVLPAESFWDPSFVEGLGEQP